MHSKRSHDVRRTNSAGLGGSIYNSLSLPEWLRDDDELDVDEDVKELDEVEEEVELDPGKPFRWFKVAAAMASIIDVGMLLALLLLLLLLRRGLLVDQGVPWSSMTK